MPDRFDRPHIDISDRAITRPYQAPRENRGGGSAPRIREQHGSRLRAELATALLNSDATRTVDDRLDPTTGVYLEIELRRGAKPDILERKSDHIVSGAIRLDENETSTVALLVPDSARAILDQILLDYAAGPLTARQQPRRKDKIEPIESIRQARLETLWSDDPVALPANPADAIWWEIWCFAGMEHSVLRAAERLGARAAAEGYRLHFPEHVVIPVFTDRVTIELMLFATVGIAELRRANASPVFFVEADREEQFQWSVALAERTAWPPNDAPAVCVLDTGVNRAHVLIEPALAAADTTTVNPAWGSADTSDGHGTGMAGLALHGDLVGPLADEREVVLSHRLESVKILPPAGFPPNDPLSYGSITQAAAALAEIGAPTRVRAFCLAVTNENVSGYRPTTWSAAIDQAAAGAMQGDDETSPRRLFIVSAGNAPPHIDAAQILPVEQYPIEDPAQAWNAITVGGYTDKVTIDDEGYEDWAPFAEAGELSPFTRTSVTWPQSKTPFKPDVVMEAGNRAVSPAGTEVLSVDSLALLTTGQDVDQSPLVPFAATSAAAAQVARLAAMLAAEYPERWPETIRALIIHSAEWTRPMTVALNKAGKRESYALLRRFGYGVPSFERAAASANNHLALIAEREITPFRSEDKRRFRDCHFYRLPWPREQLEALGDREVRLKITLSYFIEPNPGASAAIDPQRYQSHGLRFDLRRRLETAQQFIERVNALEREDPGQAAGGTPNDGWRFGSRSVSAGSLHCDEWIGPAVHLAARDIICVKPVTGWWRTRGSVDQCNRKTRYALIATLSVPGVDIDLYTPIAAIVGQQVNIEIG